MLGRSVNLTTLFLGRLKPIKQLTSTKRTLTLLQCISILGQDITMLLQYISILGHPMDFFSYHQRAMAFHTKPLLKLNPCLERV